MTTSHLPPRVLPLLYFGLAYVALALACAVVAADPRAFAGFFYHSRMVAVVHLVTLGWISSSILGAIYIVGPMALRMTIPARRLDYCAYGIYAIGVAGMVAHFWLEEFSGMAWSGAMVVVAIALVAGRVLPRLRSAPIQGAVKLHVTLAFVNVLGAGAMGVAIGFDKVFHFLPGYVLTNVFAHAHLAAIGWATMMVAGIGYRLLPMVLPAAMPSGATLYASAALLQTGAIGLFIGLMAQHRSVPIFGAVTVAGVIAFLAHVVWMRRHPRPAPAGLARPDFGVGHAVQAFAYLSLASMAGIALALLPTSERGLRLAVAYGVVGLVGFLAQMVAGMESRILPLFSWYWAFARTGFQGPVPSPHAMPARAAQRAAFYLWTAGVPLLTAGFFFSAVPLLAAGAWVLLAATVLGAANAVVTLRHAFGGHYVGRTYSYVGRTFRSGEASARRPDLRGPASPQYVGRAFRSGA